MEWKEGGMLKLSAVNMQSCKNSIWNVSFNSKWINAVQDLNVHLYVNQSWFHNK